MLIHFDYSNNFERGFFQGTGDMQVCKHIDYSLHKPLEPKLLPHSEKPLTKKINLAVQMSKKFSLSKCFSG